MRSLFELYKAFIFGLTKRRKERKVSTVFARSTPVTVTTAPETVIAEGPGYQVQTILVHPSTPPDFRPNSTADVLCLDLEEFGVSRALEWVRAAHESRRQAGETEVTPCVTALASSEWLRQLNKEDWSLVLNDLQDAGTILHEWSTDQYGTFNEAFEALRLSLSKNYGSFDTYVVDEWTVQA